jgi:hypothetical protein
MEDAMEFLFKPGDFVTTAVEADNDKPPRFMVLERLTQECIGGIQRYYDVRTFLHEAGISRQSSLRLHDFEVVAYPSEKELADRRAERALLEEAAYARHAEARAAVRAAAKKADA